MSAENNDPEAGFTAEMLADELDVEVSFQSLYPGRVWRFRLRMEMEEDTQRLQEKYAGKNATMHEQRVERLSRLLVKPPEGFSDFPPAANGDLYKAAKVYFGSKRFAHVVRGALNNYDRAVTPDQLFR